MAKRVIGNDTVLQALRCEQTDYMPIWLMRQAGRYLPEYCKVRAKAGDFWALCKNADLATEVTLQPLQRYDLDAAIVFSDILTVVDAMGLAVRFEGGAGPQIENPIRSEQDIQRLQIPDPAQSLDYVMQAMRQICGSLQDRLPVFGFSGSPFTLACYMINGHGGDFSLVRKMLYQAPELFHLLLHKLTETVILYLNAQIEAGASAVMLFDSWGGILSTPAYQQFSLAYTQRIMRGLHTNYEGIGISQILFTKGGGGWLKHMVDSGFRAIGLDWSTDLAVARAQVGPEVALQGNLDPMVLLSSPKAIEQEAQRILGQVGVKKGHVFNLGHGISKLTPPENVQVLVDCVRNHQMA